MRIPHHSTLAAYGALFVALGGTSYAATSLSANSVGTRALKNGAVTRAKLAPSVQPYSRKAIGKIIDASVTATMTSDQVLTSLANAVQGQPGLKGDPGGTGPTGPTGQNGVAGADGSNGAPGPKGDRGEQGIQGPSGQPQSRAYGHVTADGTGTTTQGATVTHPGLGLYCMQDQGFVSVVATPDSFNATTFALPPNAPNGSCGRTAWTIVVSNNGGVDTGFYFMAN